MATFITTKSLEDLFVQLNLGAVNERKGLLTQIVDDFIVIGTPTIFANKRLLVNLTFDENHVIAGFNFGEFVEAIYD